VGNVGIAELLVIALIGGIPLVVAVVVLLVFVVGKNKKDPHGPSGA
jgi:hypothetical protein